MERQTCTKHCQTGVGQECDHDRAGESNGELGTGEELSAAGGKAPEPDERNLRGNTCGVSYKMRQKQRNNVTGTKLVKVEVFAEFHTKIKQSWDVCMLQCNC